MGAGRGLVVALMSQAAQLEIPQVFALTRQTGFFLKLGFQVVPRESLPRKIWKDCITCTKFVGCDEVAVVRSVGEAGILEGWKAGRLEDWETGRLDGWRIGRLASSNDNGENVVELHYPTIQPSTSQRRRP
jgi:hypothetical protein